MSVVKIISWNLNGIRTRFKNKQLDKVLDVNPDILLFQETKANYSQLDTKLKEKMEEYKSYFSKDLESKSGGIATYTKKTPKIVTKFLKTPDKIFIGRILNIQYDNFNLIQIHAPTAVTESKTKIVLIESLIKYLKTIDSKKTIIAGDFAISNTIKDIEKSELQKAKESEFKKQAKLIDELKSIGFVDTFRKLNEDSEEYSLFKSKNAKENNIGSRVDYFFVSEDLKENIKSSSICSNVEGSKHLPIQLEIEL
ncbi:MAG: hypothetical protein LBM96_05460 [Methanobrevibacter sp.]|jgi:exodeoxyribonuclease-3|nr:hypothetical protein [Candidatus Methanoflexus mossambicus]